MKDSKPVCGVIGFGKMGRIHAEKYKDLPCNYYGHYDIATNHVSTLDDILRNCTHVSICTPAETHCDIALQAIAAGCHVLIEKPMATSYADCVRIYDAAKAAGVRVMVGHCERYDPGIRWMVDNLMPEELSACRTSAAESDRNVIYDLMIHDIDHFLSIVGNSAISKIRAVGTVKECRADIEWHTGETARAIAAYGKPIAVRRVYADKHCADLLRERIYLDGVKRLDYKYHKNRTGMDKLKMQLFDFILNKGTEQLLIQSMEAVRIADMIAAEVVK